MANRLSRPLFLPDRYCSCIMESMRGRIMPSWRIIRCRSLLVLVLAILFSKIIHNGGGKEKRMYKEKYSLHIPCIYQTNSLPNFVRFNKNAQSHWLWAEILLIMEGERMIKQNIISSASTPMVKIILYPIYRFVYPFCQKKRIWSKEYLQKVK